ncbi:MAG: type II toxin-antitoxin system VapB family antitoxin [Deltaproteobacteria bacterium]|nr:type II toxin-antitoxin system VapB family antitoxin [Deltaproteobacteria bacterium]
MKATVTLNDDLVKKAIAITNIHDKTPLLHAGLEALIAQHNSRRLAMLGGSEKKALAGPRRRRGTAV